MNKKNSARDNVNLFFSAFLILAYIICGYFFVSFAAALAGDTARNITMAAIMAIFGLLIFYATRVGEGKTVKRFSLITLIVLDLPTLYIILASIVAQLPLHDLFTDNAVVVYMAAVAFGYGVPYTFISGFETLDGDAETHREEAVLEGGVEADIKAHEEEYSEPKEQSYEAQVDEIVVEGTAVIDDSGEDEPQEEEVQE